jgi:hypothetical protein
MLPLAETPILGSPTHKDDETNTMKNSAVRAGVNTWLYSIYCAVERGHQDDKLVIEAGENDALRDCWGRSLRRQFIGAFTELYVRF